MVESISKFSQTFNNIYEIFVLMSKMKKEIYGEKRKYFSMNLRLKWKNWIIQKIVFRIERLHNLSIRFFCQIVFLSDFVRVCIGFKAYFSQLLGSHIL